MTTRSRIAAIVAALITVPTAAPALAQTQAAAAGRIKIAAGEVFVVRGGAMLPAKAGEEVLESDTLQTGADGRLGITLRDDTRISLGPDSEVRLDTFLYTPSEERLGLVLNFVRGSAVYVSGKIAQLAPDSIRLETPAAVVDARGSMVAIQVVP
ncbi:MAG TPA: FecR domain-containing protein [Vicinamibacterales bacterium]|nr:FecR domain-containing protein [Vicinamibacterales bacterium]